MSEQRVGIGYDSHRYGGEGPLILGGVEVPEEPGLAGFSDSDVLTHAVIDALLGAAALGDIGRHFPDTDPRFENAVSIDLLARVAALAADRGWRTANVDATIVCERPRIAPIAGEISERLAAALGVSSDRVSVKATTNEGMGFVGRGEGMATIAVVLLERGE